MPRKKPMAIIAAGISCGDAAELLGCSKAHVSYLIKNGELRAQRIVGRIMLVDPSSVVEYNKNPKRRDRKPAKKIIHPVTIKTSKKPSKKKFSEAVKKAQKKLAKKTTVKKKTTAKKKKTARRRVKV